MPSNYLLSGLLGLVIYCFMMKSSLSVVDTAEMFVTPNCGFSGSLSVSSLLFVFTFGIVCNVCTVLVFALLS